MASDSAPSPVTLTRKVWLEDHGMRPSTSTSPSRSTSRTSTRPGRALMTSVPVQLRARVTLGVEGVPAQRAGRPAGLHRGSAPYGERPGLAGGDEQPGQVTLRLLERRIGQFAGDGGDGLGQEGFVGFGGIIGGRVVLVLLLVGDRPFVQLEDD